MKFILAALSVPVLVAAQDYGPPPGSSAASSTVASSAAPVATPSALPGQQFVIVSPNEAFMFQPTNITAAENTTVTFLFPTSGGFMHSVTQSSFAKPCTLLEGGFDSGLQPNNFEFTLTITNASEPTWFFCTQTNPIKHCGMGMVGGINIPASSSNTIEDFLSAADAIGINEQVQTATGGLSGIGAVATAPAASTSFSAAAASGSTTPNGAAYLMVRTRLLIAVLLIAFTLA